MYIRLGDIDDIYHGKIEDVHFTANYAGEQIVGAYKQASQDYQADFEKDICCEPEDCQIPLDVIERLEKAGVNFTGIFDEDDNVVKNAQSLVDIFLQMAKINLEDLTWKFSEEKPIIEGIGHGLFSPSWID